MREVLDLFDEAIKEAEFLLGWYLQYGDKRIEDIPEKDWLEVERGRKLFVLSRSLLSNSFGEASQEIRALNGLDNAFDLAYDRIRREIEEGISSDYLIKAQERNAAIQYYRGLSNLLIESKSKVVHLRNLLEHLPEKNKHSFLTMVATITIVTIVISVGLCTIFFLPSAFSWTWLLQHPHKLGLQMSGVLILVGLCWAIVDNNKDRKSLAVGSVVIATLVAVVQLL